MIQCESLLNCCMFRTLNLVFSHLLQVLEVRHISSLPCLENLTLTGNPVTIVVDYRTKILELFGNRTTEVFTVWYNILEQIYEVIRFFSLIIHDIQ